MGILRRAGEATAHRRRGDRMRDIIREIAEMDVYWISFDIGTKYQTSMCLFCEGSGDDYIRNIDHKPDCLWVYCVEKVVSIKSI